jgi:hypothetical protein
MSDQEDDQQRFNATLLRLLKSPPEPRSERKRGREKPTRKEASEASKDTRAPSA